MTRQRAYLLPEVLCPETTLDICISIPNDLGHIMPFLAQIEYLANWYAWETNLDRDNDTVAACWRDIFNSVRSSIDNSLGCGTVSNVKDIRMVDCVIEKQDFDDVWTAVGSVEDCVIAGISAAIENGTIGNSAYPAIPAPTTNATNTTERDVACGIADFTSNYLIEKWNDQLDLIEALASGGATIAKIAADVVSAVTGIGIIAGGAVDAIKDMVDGSIALTFAVIRAADTVEWRSAIKCIFYNHLKDHGANFGTTLDDVVKPIIADIASEGSTDSPILAKFLSAFALQAFQRLAKISEDNEGECDDCDSWCYELDLTSPLPSWITIEYGTQEADGVKSQSGLLPRTDTTGDAYGALAGITITMPADGQIETIIVTANMQDSLTNADTRHFNTFYHSVVGRGAIPNVNGTQVMESTPTSDFTMGESFYFRVGAGWTGGSTDFGYHTMQHIKFMGFGANPFGADNCA